MSPQPDSSHVTMTEMLRALIISAGYYVDQEPIDFAPYELPTGVLVSHLRILAPIRKSELNAYMQRFKKTKPYKKQIKKHPDLPPPLPTRRLMGVIWFNNNPKRLQGTWVIELFGQDTHQSMYALAHRLYLTASEEVRVLLRVVDSRERYE